MREYEDRPIKIGDIIELKIDGTGSKGDGFGKIDNFVVMVPNTREGETVKVRITRVLRKMAFGELAEGDSAASQGEQEEVPMEQVEVPMEQHVEEESTEEEPVEEESTEEEPVEEESTEEEPVEEESTEEEPVEEESTEEEPVETKPSSESE
jgi:predicted RNA-binding protein with TRAM domain